MLQNSSKMFFVIGLWFFTLQNYGIKGDNWMRTRNRNGLIEKDKTTTDVFNKASTAENAGDYDTAIKLYMQLVHLYETLQGPEDPDSIKMFINLHRVYFNSHKYDKAFPLAWKIYKLEEKILGKEHPDTVEALADLGKNYVVRGKIQKGEEILKRAYRLTKAQLGQNHEKTVEILSMLAEMYRDSREPKNLELALRYFNKIYDVRSKSSDPEMGEEHEKTVEALRNIGNVLALQEKLTEAVTVFEKVLEILRRTVGEDHPLTQEVKHVLFVTLSSSGKLGEARNLVQNGKQSPIQDVDDEALFDLVEGKAIVLGDKGKYTQALEILTELYEHEILKPHLSPKIITVLDKLIGFSRNKDDRDLILNWASIMIDLAQRQHQNQNQQEAPKVMINTEREGSHMILIHLSALEAAIYVHIQNNDEKKVDDYLMAAREVYKGQIQGQGQEQSILLLQKYFGITRIVADFKTKIGKIEDAKVLYQVLVQSGYGDPDLRTDINRDKKRKTEL